MVNILVVASQAKSYDATGRYEIEKSIGIRYRASRGLDIEEPFAYYRHWSSCLADLATISQPTTTLLLYSELLTKTTHRYKMTLKQRY